MTTYGRLADTEQTEAALAAWYEQRPGAGEYAPREGDRVEYFITMDQCWVPGTVTGTGDFDDGRPIYDVRIDPGATAGGQPIMGRDRWGYGNQFRPLVDPLMEADND
jgi:hypothetical protein